METILLVENEVALRELMRRFLEGSGYAVLNARDGDEALSVASAHSTPIDLLLTDVVMPGPDGVEVARRLRATRPDLAVAFMSGYSEHGTDGPGPESEWRDSLLPKPFMPHELLAHVRRALDLRATTVRANGA